VQNGAEWTVFQGAVSRTLVLFDRLAADARDADKSGKLIAPMPGKIVAVHVAPGDAVKRGQKLIVLEAMKMEHTILAPADGVVARVRFKAGEQAAEGEELVGFDEPAEKMP
jgi:3-methylcrotonyl-CoA carboxylase alpha subunit